MTAKMILQRANEWGVLLTITQEGNLKARGDKSLVNQLMASLVEYKGELIRLIQQSPEIQAFSKPFIVNNELRIPCNCHPKYKWWAGGQSVSETLVELEASDCIMSRYTSRG